MLAPMIARLLLALALLLATAASADDETRAMGVMDATAFAPVPRGAAIAVRPPDGSSESRDIAAVLAETLDGLGHALNPGAALQLSFRIGDLPGATVARPPNVELRGSLGAEGNEDAEVVLRMQMLDRSRPNLRTRTRLIVIELAERSGRPLWEARVEAAAAVDDDVALAEALAPHILAHLGRPAYALRLPELRR